MLNGTAIFLGALLIAAGVAISGTVTEYAKQSLNDQKRAVCWDAGLTPGLNALATQLALPSFKTLLPSELAQKDQDAIATSFGVSMSSYAFTGASADWGTVNCSGTLTYTYTRPDGSIFTSDGGNIATYTVHPAQQGETSEMSGADFPPGLFQYVDDPNPPPDPPTPVATAQPPASGSASTAPAPAAVPPPVADYNQGHADRMDWEDWVNNLQGAEKQGAVFWSAQRSLASPEDCAAGAADAAPDNESDQTAFQNGCEEATTRLVTSDLKRKNDPLYKAGWNEPLPSDASADGSAPAQ